MPHNKNQHYVPKCHLKPFTLDREGAAINMFNHVQGIVRANVSVSGQCAKSYFYGEDLVIETHLQSYEGRYARVVRSVEEGEPPSEADLMFLRDFVLLQWCRTDGALRRRREVIQAMDDLVFRGAEHLRRETPDLSQLALVAGSLRIWASVGDDIADLRVLILRNRSRVDFVTSDDPAVVTNRVFLQRLHDTNFGITNVGTMFLMPLGPRHAVVCYDDESYVPVGRVSAYINLTRDRDAQAFNELQFLNSLSNIYFSGPAENGDRVRANFAAVAHRRPVERFRMWQGVSEGLEGDFEVFRRVEQREEIAVEQTRIQSFSPLYPEPSRWMSLLKMRENLRGWIVPGAVGGPIRTNRARRISGVRPIRIGHGPLPHRRGELPDRMYHRLSREERDEYERRAMRRVERVAERIQPTAVAVDGHELEPPAE